MAVANLPKGHHLNAKVHRENINRETFNQFTSAKKKQSGRAPTVEAYLQLKTAGYPSSGDSQYRPAND
jgi:hypothetical protein